MQSFYVKDFNLQKTLESGQIFHYKKVEGDAYLVATGKKALFVKQKEEKLYFSGASKEEIKNIFGLNDDLNKIYKEITKDGKDKILVNAIKKFSGTRIIQQDPFECLISYILSINSNIPRIKKNVEDLCKKYGKEVKINSYSINLFPSFERLKNVSLEEFEKLGFGFRAKFIKQTISLLPKIDLYSLQNKNFEEAKKELMSLPGVGEKVAECVLLYSFKKLEAFPVDIWMKRIMSKYYLKKEATIKEIKEFAKNYFGKYAGYAQLYLFLYAREMKIK
jgi:N-glycosylase/DNA lyase